MLLTKVLYYTTKTNAMESNVYAKFTTLTGNKIKKDKHKENELKKMNFRSVSSHRALSKLVILQTIQTNVTFFGPFMQFKHLIVGIQLIIRIYEFFEMQL